LHSFSFVILFAAIEPHCGSDQIGEDFPVRSSLFIFIFMDVFQNVGNAFLFIDPVILRGGFRSDPGAAAAASLCGRHPCSFAARDDPVFQIDGDAADRWKMLDFSEDEVDIGWLHVSPRALFQRAVDINNVCGAGDGKCFEIDVMTDQDAADALIDCVTGRGITGTHVRFSHGFDLKR
jgi:hypothetical protein